MNKASGGDGIPAELFQILKDDAVKVLHSVCQKIWKTQQWPQEWKKLVFTVIPKKGNAKECSNYHTVVPIPQLAKSKEELKSLLMKVKEESEKKKKEESEKFGLKLNIQKPKIMASGPITSWQTDGETMETVRDFLFLGSKITADGDYSHAIKRCLVLGKKL